MTLRRDFLALTAAAVVARTVLPIAAQARPRDPRAEFLEMFAQLGDAEQEAFLRGLERHQAGTPFIDAMRGIYADLGRPVPRDVEARFLRLHGAA